MAAEKTLLIAGSTCEIPTLDTFNMDEAQVLYDYAGLTIEDFAPSDDPDADEADLEEKLKNPAFVRVLMHVAYQRANPRMSKQKVQTVIGSEKVLDILGHLLEQVEEDDALPPALTTEPGVASPNGSVGSSESSGEDSEKSSAGQVVQLAPTTTTGSGTPATPSLQAGSAH